MLRLQRSEPRRRSSPVYTIAPFAGTGTAGTALAGPATSSPLHYPYGAAVDPGGNTYIADLSNYTIDKVASDGTPVGDRGYAGRFWESHDPGPAVGNQPALPDRRWRER